MTKSHGFWSAEVAQELPLAGKVALVTGSGRNIGAAVAGRLGRMGAKVVVNVRASIDEGKAVCASLGEQGIDSTLRVADVSDSAQVRELGDDLIASFGRVDVLVNNVGISPMMPITETTDDFWHLVLNTSLSSAFFCTRAFAPGMIEARWGRIINIGGVAGIRGTKFKTANAAAKAGLSGLTRSTANELGEFGITCNFVGPGHLERVHERKYYKDESDTLDPGFSDRWAAMIPRKRLGTADDVASGCAFLASPDADYVTGQTLLVNGGMFFT
jgi:3-oxoacyl-[acyl-carrier protein] reductase